MMLSISAIWKANAGKVGEGSSALTTLRGAIIVQKGLVLRDAVWTEPREVRALVVKTSSCCGMPKVWYRIVLLRLFNLCTNLKSLCSVHSTSVVAQISCYRVNFEWPIMCCRMNRCREAIVDRVCAELGCQKRGSRNRPPLRLHCRKTLGTQLLKRGSEEKVMYN